MMHRRLACLALILGAVLPLAGCKIVPFAEEGAATPAGFNAQTYAAGLWNEQALPHFAQAARPTAQVLPAIAADLQGAGAEFGYRAGEGSPWSFIVNGSGTVTARNTESRAGTLEVALEGVDQSATIQIGPVIRGNAVRDALPFVSFKDFTNQLEYANAGKALTALAVAGFASAAETIAVGDTVSFTGAISVSKAGDAVLITPITLEKAAP